MGIIMDDFYYDESDNKHVFLKCIIIVFIIGICVGGFIYYKNKNTIRLKRIVVELGSDLSLNVNDYLMSGEKYSSDYKLYLDDVNVNKVGTYNYKIRYNKHVKNGKIIVEDTIKPEVNVSNISVGIDEEIKAIYLVTSCKDLALPCSAVFEDENILTKIKIPGVYETNIRVSDANGNSVSKKVIITSKENESFNSIMTSDLGYYTNSINDFTIGKVLFKKLDVAIDEDTLEFENLIQTISAEDFSTYTDKEIDEVQLITAYNRYGFVIGVQVLAQYTDGTKELLENRGEE